MPQDNKAPTRLQGVGLSGLAGVQRGLSADLFGLPVDTVANIADLGLAGYGTAAGFLGRQNLAPDLLDRSQVVGSGDWIAGQLSRTGALMGPVEAESGADRAAFAFGRGGSAAIFGLRDGPLRTLEEGLRGGVSMLAAEQAGASSGNPALAASAALIAGNGRRYSGGIASHPGADKNGRAPTPPIRMRDELDWQRFIADTLARVLPDAKSQRRPRKRPENDHDADGFDPQVSVARRKSADRKWPDSNAILNSAEYRAYRAGIDEFGLPRDLPARKGLGESPFYGKTFDDIDKLLKARRFEARGKNPATGLGSYFHPKSGRKYYLDKGRDYREGEKLPHVDVHRMKDGVNLEKIGKRRFPLGDELVIRK